LLFTGCQAKLTKVVFALQPNEENAALELFGKELSSRINLKVENRISSDYESIINWIRQGRVDVALLSPANVVAAHEKAKAKILLKVLYGKDSFYYSSLLVHKDSQYKNLKDLQGKRIAFVDPSSTSGFLMPAFMMAEAMAPIVEAQKFFAGTHEKALESLVARKVEAAAVWAEAPELKKGAWTANKAFAANTRVLAYSEPIPNDAIVVREDFYKDHPLVVYGLMQALIELGEQKILKKVFDVDGVAPATIRHYDSVLKLQKFIKAKRQ